MRVWQVAWVLLALALPASAQTVTYFQTGNGQGSAAVSPSNPLPVAVTSAAQGAVVQTKPGVLTLVALDAATVSTGGTAVEALASGHRSAGGWLTNPVDATGNLFVNEIGTATTTEGGSVIAVPPGATLQLTPSGNAVSVNASDSGHVFFGYGWQ